LWEEAIAISDCFLAKQSQAIAFFSSSCNVPWYFLMFACTILAEEKEEIT
jgi:hypothetical protein